MKRSKVIKIRLKGGMRGMGEEMGEEMGKEIPKKEMDYRRIFKTSHMTLSSAKM